MIEDAKPYLVEVENHVEGLQYGTLEVKLYVRAGVVAKMEFTETRTWLKEKALDPNSKP